jgi:hypothetical protein
LYDYLKSKTHEVASEAEKEIKINSHSWMVICWVGEKVKDKKAANER